MWLKAKGPSLYILIVVKWVISKLYCILVTGATEKGTVTSGDTPKILLGLSMIDSHWWASNIDSLMWRPSKAAC